jgi:signal transduction histidine kinase
MSTSILTTEFAPAERASAGSLKEQNRNLSANPLIAKILDAVPEAVMILNGQRQIVYVNRETLTMLGIDDMSTVFGLRPGEMLKCRHALETDGGCGTTRFCQHCGATRAILDSQQGKIAAEEISITRHDTGTALELKIKASPYFENNQFYSVLSISDVSGEKRKQALESIFFHDILNTAGGLFGFAELLLKAGPKDVDNFKAIIYQLSQHIIDEINAQRQLIEAENGSLQTDPVDADSQDILETIAETYRNQEIATGKQIEISTDSERIAFQIDRTLLLRVLGNLLKNALEAGGLGAVVRLDARRNEDLVCFSVWNAEAMPLEIQMQVFKRSYSTKGKGRGLGTYGIKLLTERYLKGQVSFTSGINTGTTFFACYPIDPSN